MYPINGLQADFYFEMKIDDFGLLNKNVKEYQTISLKFLKLIL
jgi:hypothetical protein